MPTRSGWLAVAGGVLAVVAGRLFGVYELYVLGGGMVAFVLAAVAFIRLRPLDLAAQRRVTPVYVHAGDVARVEIGVRNRAKRRTPLIELDDPVSGSGGARLDLAPFAGQSTATATYRLPTHRRGALSIGPLTLRRRDVLGLASSTAAGAPHVDLLVYPRWHSVTVPGTATAGGALGDHLRQRALGRAGEEFRSLRAYQPGDDLRSINWRASARSEDLIVRELEAANTRSVVVVLDTAAASHTEESFEAAVEATASVVLSAVDQRVPLQFATTGGGAMLGASASADEVLAQLARVTPTATAAPVAEVCTALGSRAEGGVIVLIGGTISPAAAHSVRYAHGSDALLVVACASPTPTDLGSAVFIVAAPPGVDFPTAWHRVVAPRKAMLGPIQMEVAR